MGGGKKSYKYASAITADTLLSNSEHVQKPNQKRFADAVGRVNANERCLTLPLPGHRNCVIVWAL